MRSVEFIRDLKSLLHRLLPCDKPRPPRLIQRLQLGGTKARHAILLIVTQPRLLAIAQDTPSQEIHHQPNNNQHKSNRVQRRDRIPKDVDTNNDAPEITRQQANVKKRRGAHAQQKGREAVKDEQTQRVTHNIPNHGAIPHRLLKSVAIKDTRRRAADHHANNTHETQDLVRGPPRDIPLLKHVAEPIARRARETKQVAFQLLGRVVVVGARHGVAAEEHAHAATGDEDAEELKGPVAHLEQQERDDDDADDGPKVEQLGREEVGVAVGEDGEVVALDVEKRKDKVLPAVGDDDAPDLAGPVAVKHVRDVHEAEQDVVEEALERGDGGAVVGEEGGEGARGGVGEAEELAEGEDEPKVIGFEVGVPVNVFGFDLAQARGHGGGGGGVVAVVAVVEAGGRAAVDVRLYGAGGCAIVAVVA